MIGTLFGAALAELVSEEIRGQLDRIPIALLRIARRRLPENMRVSLHDEEWYPELQEVLRGEDARPLSRLVLGIRYSVGLIRSAHVVASIRDRRATLHADRERWQAIVEVMRIPANLCVLITGMMISASAGVLLGVLLTQLLSIGGATGPALGAVLGWALTVAFGTSIGLAITLLLTTGLLAATRRLLLRRAIRVPVGKIPTPPREPLRRRAMNVLLGPHRDNVHGVRAAAFLGSYAGVGLGILLGTELAAFWQPLLVTGLAVASLLILRVSLVSAPRWWLKRLQNRLKAAEPPEPADQSQSQTLP
ncbi:hypothetical protein [Nonomuraea insulae]|uniref:Type II secretion system protein GspF domain-containing protein n=1 Tax=Nonomuraea insulae TaxID=1616787 RepID=A0ABW1DF31_9ACTN